MSSVYETKLKSETSAKLAQLFESKIRNYEECADRILMKFMDTFTYIGPEHYGSYIDGIRNIVEAATLAHDARDITAEQLQTIKTSADAVIQQIQEGVSKQHEKVEDKKIYYTSKEAASNKFGMYIEDAQYNKEHQARTERRKMEGTYNLTQPNKETEAEKQLITEREIA